MATEPKPGDVIEGRYELHHELGRGGHGVVFRAEDRETGQPVALKILNQAVTDDPQYTVRLTLPCGKGR